MLSAIVNACKSFFRYVKNAIKKLTKPKTAVCPKPVIEFLYQWGAGNAKRPWRHEQFRLQQKPGIRHGAIIGLAPSFGTTLPFSDNRQPTIESILTAERAEDTEKKPLRSPCSPR